MAPVNGQPFLAYVLAYLQKQEVEEIVFALGYKSQLIEDYVNAQPKNVPVTFVVEETPLGTGGAIKAALEATRQEQVIVLNGDTLFRGDLSAALQFHLEKKAACTLLLKPMQEFERYGVVEIDRDGRIVSFREKQYYEAGLINAGSYVIDRGRFLSEDLPPVFSFEKDYLEKLFTTRPMYALVQDAYFIDIGIPEDYERAGRELPVLHD